MKKGIIIDLGGQMGNQLWTYLSIWTYCHEKGYDCRQLAFYQYSHHFPQTRGHWLITPFFNSLNRILPKKKSFIKNFLYRKLVLNFLIKKTAQLLNARGFNDEMIFLLPPTKIKNTKQAQKINELETCSSTIYFNGPNFRNQTGAIKYHSEICNLFSPQQQIKKKINAFIGELRNNYNFLVGVHIRQTDYRTFDKNLYFPPEKVAVILADFLATRKPEEKICFIIASDEKINLQVFGSLPTINAPGGIIEDLFTLANTDFIIGSNSTYSTFSAYYGDIPMAIFKHDKIDWGFYAKQKKFFFNPESIVNLYS
jgi:hypothetical protein